MGAPRPLETVIADWRERAQVLRRTGHEQSAQLVEQVLHDVEPAAEEYVRWLSEDDAILRSGRTRAWLRKQFSAWERQGHAKRDGRRRLYRMLIIPQRANTLAAREAGRRAGAGAA